LPDTLTGSRIAEMERTAAGDELIDSLPLQHDGSTHFGRIASLWAMEFTSTNHARWPKTDFHQAQRIESWLLLQLFTNDATRIYRDIQKSVAELIFRRRL
jgi:hypothetical protein